MSKAAKYSFLTVALVILTIPLSSAIGGVKASYLYGLSNFSGLVPYSWVGLSTDRQKDEVYVITASELRIFNASGMEVYNFVYEGGIGNIYDAAVDERNGNIIILTSEGITVADYRGEPVSKIDLKNIPPEFSKFLPGHIFLQDGRLYLCDSFSKKVIITDLNGLFEKGYDIAALLDREAKEGEEEEMGGFSVDRKGNILFTIPVLFKAFVLSPEGKIEAFGEKGSGPGRFGVIGGIASDERGNYYVADGLRSVVLVFDEGLRFQTEFGYRGDKPENLVGPKTLAVGKNGKVYVSQLRNRGVTVFKAVNN